MSVELKNGALQSHDLQNHEVRNDDLKLLVEWSSPWSEFITAIGPALGKSPKRLAGEARTDSFPYRGMLLSWLVEAIVLIAVRSNVWAFIAFSISRGQSCCLHD